MTARKTSSTGLIDPIELVGTHSRIEHKANSEEWDKREGVRINCIPGTEREHPSDSHFGT